MGKSNKIFDSSKINKLKITLASSEKIKKWAKREQITIINLYLLNENKKYKIKKSFFGEVTSPLFFQSKKNIEKFHNEGLFSEMIFGPRFNFKCLCRHQKSKFNIFHDCPKCYVTFTLNKIRDYRMGYIPLITPVFNPLFLLSNINFLKLIFGEKEKALKDSIYFNFSKQNQANYVNNLNEALKALNFVFGVFKGKVQHVDEIHQINLRLTRKSFSLNDIIEKTNIKKYLNKYLSLFKKDFSITSYFNERIFKFLDNFDLLKELNFANQKLPKTKITSFTYTFLFKKIRLLENFYKTKTNLSSIMLKTLPVTPPNFRPYDPEDLDGSATSKINFLYQHVLFINERLTHINSLNISNKKFLIINEIRLLQESIDFLLDNNKVTKGQLINDRPSISLVDVIKGKEGRFRKSILGKRINFSARSVIVVNPLLNINHCGIPVKILKNLLSFKIKKIINKLDKVNLININNYNIIYLEILKRLVKNEIIMLNRAPTLHKLGIQSFNVLLTNNDAIELHPLVCSVYNADFDGDQMAVYLPLTKVSQLELNLILKSTKDLFLFGNSNLKMKPTQELILGLNYLGQPNYLLKNFSFGNYFNDYNEFFSCFLQKKLRVFDPIWFKFGFIEDKKFETPTIINNYVRMTPGQLIVNRVLAKKIFN